MNEIPEDPLGAAWLMKTYAVKPLMQLPVISRAGGRRATSMCDGVRLQTFPDATRPPATFAGHLHFHLRYEVLHLEFLARLFEQIGPAELQAWVDAEPTGQYARRAAFLWEWLTATALVPPPRLGGNYVDAVDASGLLAASADQVVRVARWRVNDNLPGTRHFCPLVVKTEALTQAASLDVKHLLGELSTEFGEDLLLRAAAWLTLRESKASFAIEGEVDRVSRIQRFADVMARRTGQGEVPLEQSALAEIQRDILGDVTTLTQLGLRQSPVFVGQTMNYQEVVHYVAPPAAELHDMLAGLRICLQRTRGQSPVLRCALAAFGLVYIHPLADGNGRVHRFLINDILRRDGVVPDPLILPVSAVITDDVSERLAYNRVLDSISAPLTQAVRSQVEFSATRTRYPDGVSSNFVFHGGDQARPVWRYPDLTPHVLYVAHLLYRTLTEQMRQESNTLRTHLLARMAIKDIVEMPDQQADRVVRSIRQNQGALSGVLTEEMPVLATPGVWLSLVSAVQAVFKDQTSA